ncbi:MAG TPA: aminoacyl-tRNA hydrolase [Terriglobia bacterium]|nr:aminoacyl-tRNA hydrolase [Terriglobia bacterium]
MKLVVGLGNPGVEYRHSPHNLGFAVVERLARRFGVRLDRKRAHSLCARVAVDSGTVWLIQPQTYMNRSGEAVREWLRKEGCGPEELLVIADELDLPWGTIRIRQRGSSAGHHGVESIIGAIGSREFARVRIGVAPEQEEDTGDAAAYLLRPVRRSQRERLEEVVERAADATEMILREGIAKAMNRFNQRPRTPRDAA